VYLEWIDQATNVLLDAPTSSVQDRHLGRYKPGSKLGFESRLPWRDVEVDHATKAAEKSPILCSRLWGSYVEDRGRWTSKVRCGRRRRRYMNLWVLSWWSSSSWPALFKVDYVMSGYFGLGMHPPLLARRQSISCQVGWCATDKCLSLRLHDSAFLEKV
jgi:hypothetical protein